MICEVFEKIEFRLRFYWGYRYVADARIKFLHLITFKFLAKYF